MSQERACWRCKWFDREEDEVEDGGYCRRYPPSPTNSGTACMWVGVEYLDWCGEFEEDDE